MPFFRHFHAECAITLQPPRRYGCLRRFRYAFILITLAAHCWITLDAFVIADRYYAVDYASYFADATPLPPHCRLADITITPAAFGHYARFRHWPQLMIFSASVADTPLRCYYADSVK